MMREILRLLYPSSDNEDNWTSNSNVYEPIMENDLSQLQQIQTPPPEIYTIDSNTNYQENHTQDLITLSDILEETQTENINSRYQENTISQDRMNLLQNSSPISIHSNYTRQLTPISILQSTRRNSTMNYSDVTEHLQLLDPVDSPVNLTLVQTPPQVVRRGSIRQHTRRTLLPEDGHSGMTRIDLTLESDSEDEITIPTTMNPSNEVILADDEDEDDGVEILHTQPAPERTVMTSPYLATVLSVSSPEVTTPPPTNLPTTTGVKRRRTNPTMTDISVGSKRKRTKPIDCTISTDSEPVSHNAAVLEQFKSALRCCICLDAMQNITSTICGHIFCGPCIKHAVQTAHRCPLCKKKLRKNDMHPLYFC